MLFHMQYAQRVEPTMADIPRLLSGRPVLPPLSGKQEELLLWVIEYSEKNGFYPVMREIATHFGLTLSRIQALMAQLEKRGYVAKTATRSRNLQLTDLTKSWLERRTEKEKEQDTPSQVSLFSN